MVPTAKYRGREICEAQCRYGDGAIGPDPAGGGVVGVVGAGVAAPALGAIGGGGTRGPTLPNVGVVSGIVTTPTVSTQSTAKAPLFSHSPQRRARSAGS